MRPEELMAEVIRALKSYAEDAAGAAMAGAVITVPVSYREHNRELMRWAAGNAGCSRIELLVEPVAAIGARAAQKGSEPLRDGRVLVYDLGGGTFDAALVELEDGAVRVAGYGGLPDVGGTNFTRAIERDLAERAGPRLRELIAGARSDDPAARTAALRAQNTGREFCRGVKHDLSSLNEVEGSILLAPEIEVEYSLSRERFAAMIAPDIARTIESCRDVMRAAEQDLDAVDGILLVGGSCRMPLVGDTVEAQLGRPIWRVADPELAVSQGAARQAASIEGASGIHGRPRLKTVTVDPTGEGDHTTMAEALAIAESGDTIKLRPGTYAESLELRQDVTLMGEGPRERIIVEPPSGPALTCSGPAPRVAGLSLRTSDRSANTIEIVGGAPVIESCELSGAGPAVVSLAGGTRAALRGNRIHDTPRGGMGIGVGARARPTIEYNEIAVGRDQPGIVVAGEGAEPTILQNRIHGTSIGINMHSAAGGEVRANEVVACVQAGIAVGGTGTAPTVRGNAVHSSETGAGISIYDGATPIVEDNDVGMNGALGIAVGGTGSLPEIRENQVHDTARGSGIVLFEGAGGTLEDNEVVHNGLCGIELRGEGTAAVLRGNRAEANGRSGIYIEGGAAGRLEDNALTGNGLAGIEAIGSTPAVVANHSMRNPTGFLLRGTGGEFDDNRIVGSRGPGIEIRGDGAQPTLRRNRVVEGAAAGIYVHGGATPIVEDNDVSGNRGPGLAIQDGAPIVRSNRLRGNDGGAISGRGGSLEGNEIWSVKPSYPAIGLAALLEGGRVDEADAEAVGLLRQFSGQATFASMQQAAAIPDALLHALDHLYREATGRGLRSRPWATDPGAGVTAPSGDGATWLLHHLQARGLW